LLKHHILVLILVRHLEVLLERTLVEIGLATLCEDASEL
jgi:hypothetical protein